MRQIKFRAWFKLFEEMKPVVGFTQYHEDNLTVYFGQVGSHTCTKNDVVLMQSTGLKDKNGKEIYEGDVIQCKFYCAHRKWWSNLEEKKELDQSFQRQKEDIETLFGVVQFDNGEYRIRFPWNSVELKYVSYGSKTETSSGYGADSESRWFDFEVIGNIYENPELLQAI